MSHLWMSYGNLSHEEKHILPFTIHYTYNNTLLIFEKEIRYGCPSKILILSHTRVTVSWAFVDLVILWLLVLLLCVLLLVVLYVIVLTGAFCLEVEQPSLYRWHHFFFDKSEVYGLGNVLLEYSSGSPYHMEVILSVVYHYQTPCSWEKLKEGRN